ncbi:MAG: hypothetical protein KA953_01135 [Lachnospiraceae bacterium]|nr:hypothetical protein [Lachnospiraceae bacterium]
MKKYDWRFPMPWCPKCKNEYVPGITECSDCNVELVESLEDTPSFESSAKEGSNFLHAANSPMYTKASERKEEYSSSYTAFVFLFLLCTILVVLSEFKKIPLFEDHVLPLQYTIILSCIAVVSLILAYYARKKSRHLLLEAQEEELKLSDLIFEFQTRDDIPQVDSSLFAEDQFFLQNEWILSTLHSTHPDYSESYCDYAAEQLYNHLFDEKE